MGRLDVQEDREAPGDAHGDLDETDEGVVPGEDDLELLGSWLGGALLEALDEGLVPALDPLGLAGELRVEGHLDAAPEHRGPVQRLEQAGVEPDEGLGAVHVLGRDDPPDDGVFVLEGQLAAELSHEGALARAEDTPDEDRAGVSFLGSVPVVADCVEVGLAGDVQLVRGLFGHRVAPVAGSSCRWRS